MPAASASARIIHVEPKYEFGTDGTSATSIPNVASLTYNQATNQVLALTTEAPRKIYRFNFNGPGSFSPSGGSFPINVPGGGNTVPQIDVDNSGTANAGSIVYAPGGPDVLSYSPSGTALAPLSPNAGSQKCGAAVDPTGHPWADNYEGRVVEKFNWSGGGPIDSVSTTAQQEGCNITFDRATGDLYVSTLLGCCGTIGTFRYTAASGYALSSAKRFDSGNSDHLAVDPVRHVLYVAGATGVKAYNTETGQLIEEFGTDLDIEGIAVDQHTGTVFTTAREGVLEPSDKIQEWPALVVPDVALGEPEGNAKLTGSVGLAGAGEVTECKFEWRNVATTPSFSEHSTPCSPATPYSSDQPTVYAEPPFEMEQTYAYRLTAKNANGTSTSDAQTITPHHVLALRTGAATEIGRSSATLHASFIGNGEDTTYVFEWGTNSVTETISATEDAGSPTGPTQISIHIGQFIPLSAGTTYQYRVIATNGEGQSIAETKTFETLPAVKDVQTGPATDVLPASATLHGSLDPDGLETEYFFEYGKSTAYGQKIPLPAAQLGTTTPGSVPVNVALEELESGATYHYRLVGVNEFGSTAGNDESFETPQPPSIISVSSKNVTASTAELTGRLDSNGYKTTYWFEYGTTVGYGSKAPVPSGTLEPGTETEEKTVQLTGLSPTTYHFRLVAENKWGTTTSEDQTFNFNPPEGCPNSAVRQQTGAAYLPDCRAYELVSPGNAAGSALHAIAPYSVQSSGRFAFLGTVNTIPGTGEPMNGARGDLYAATRTTSGWKSRYIGLTGRQAACDGPPRIEEMGPGAIETDAAMNRFVIFNWGNKCEFNVYTKEGSNIPYVYDNEGNEVLRLPTNYAEIPGSTNDLLEGGFVGDSRLSGDGRHYIFGARELAFAPGGLDAAPGSVYDNDIETGTVTVISKTEGGEDIKLDQIASSGNEFLRILAVSSDGSHVLMATRAPGQHEQLGENVHLYMSVNDNEHFEVSKGSDGENHDASFVGMTSDGSVVYFTSPDELTSEDTDANVDLYKWSDQTNAVTLVSKGSGESGNRASCSAAEGWIAGCSIEPIPTPARQTEIPGRTLSLNKPLASDAGDIYFYSPEQLDGARGTLGSRNLYVYRAGGIHFVATLDPSHPVEQINVSPNGSHAGILTRTALTPYNSQSHSEMYVYDAANRSIKCVSCLPNGDPPTSDVKASQNGLFMTEDGRAFFSTRDPLVIQDANGISDVYEFVQGRAQLITSGTGDTEGGLFQPTGLVGVTENGTDAFFATFDSLVPEDENGTLLKFYDARTNGGFPFNKPPAPCAAADECHGESSSPPANPIIGTGAALGSRGNLAGSAHKRHARCKGKHKGKRRSCHRKKSHSKHRRGRRHG